MDNELLNVGANLRVAHHEVAQGSSHVESTELLRRSSIPIPDSKLSISAVVSLKVEGTHESSTELINWSIGIKVVLVLELASEKRKEVAADTGAAKSSYSSYNKAI